MPQTYAADLGRADTAHPYTATRAALQESARHREVKKPGAQRRRLWGPPARRRAPSGMTSEEGAPPFLLSSPRKRGSSGSCGAPVWIPARPCGPSGMTSKLGAVREGRPARRRAPTTMTLQGAKERHILFAVIPAKAGIQRHLRGARLDPGSALRAVRDDVKRRGAVRDDVSRGGRRSGWHQMLGGRPVSHRGGDGRPRAARPDASMSHVPSPGFRRFSDQSDRQACASAPRAASSTRHPKTCPQALWMNALTDPGGGSASRS